MMFFLFQNVLVNLPDLGMPIGKSPITILPRKFAQEKPFLIDEIAYVDVYHPVIPLGFMIGGCPAFSIILSSLRDFLKPYY